MPAPPPPCPPPPSPPPPDPPPPSPPPPSPPAAPPSPPPSPPPPSPPPPSPPPPPPSPPPSCPPYSAACLFVFVLGSPQGRAVSTSTTCGAARGPTTRVTEWPSLTDARPLGSKSSGVGVRGPLHVAMSRYIYVRMPGHVPALGRRLCVCSLPLSQCGVIFCPKICPLDPGLGPKRPSSMAMRCASLHWQTHLG